MEWIAALREEKQRAAAYAAAVVRDLGTAVTVGRKGRGRVTGEGLGRKSLQEVLNEEVVVISQVPR